MALMLFPLIAPTAGKSDDEGSRAKVAEQSDVEAQVTFA